MTSSNVSDRPDIPGLSFVTATTYSNPAWYLAAVVAGFIEIPPELRFSGDAIG